MKLIQLLTTEYLAYYMLSNLFCKTFVFSLKKLCINEVFEK